MNIPLVDLISLLRHISQNHIVDAETIREAAGKAADIIEDSIESYEQFCQTTAVYPEAGYQTERELNYLLHGFAGEAGETNNKFKKFLRGGQVTLDAYRRIEHSLTPEQKLILTDEIGDTLWYIALLARTLDTTIMQIAGQNCRKLMQRKDTGTLHERPFPSD